MREYENINKTSAIQFIVNKLVIAICFVALIVISYTIQGKLINFITSIILPLLKKDSTKSTIYYT